MKTGALALIILLLASATPAQDGSYAGLWVGTATIQAVSEPQSAPVVPASNSLAVIVTNNPPLVTTNTAGVVSTNQYTTNFLQLIRTNVNLTPTPVQQAATLRLLLHVDASNRASLLKEVTLMVDSARSNTPVLITDPRLFGSYDGISVRNGTLVGRRISSTHFDFPDNHLPMSGTVGTNVTSGLVVTNRIAFDHPTNPYKHKYHPDHDNLDPTFTLTRAEAWDITRLISLKFSPTNVGSFSPGYGVSRIDGQYLETISGLMSTNINVAGTFELRKVSSIAKLNEQP